MASNTKHLFRVSIDKSTAKVMAGNTICCQGGKPKAINWSHGPVRPSMKAVRLTFKGPMIRGLSCRLNNSGQALKAMAQ
jgi:hypothetical protein